MIDYRQYAGKKVLLTGHTGFKGAWTVAVLHSLGTCRETGRGAGAARAGVKYRLRRPRLRCAPS